MSRSNVRNYLQLHLVVLAWGLTAILGRLIVLPPVDVVLWRTLLAALCFVGLAGCGGRSLRIPGREMGALLGVGGILGLHWILFFWSARLATASVSLAALPTAMLWCSLIEPVIDGSRRWRWAELVVGGVMVGAVWLIYQVEFRYWRGFSAGIGAAMLAACFATLSKQQVAGERHWSVIGSYQMTGACLVTFMARPMLANGPLPSLPEGADVLWLLVLALVCTVAAYAAFMDVLRHVSIFTVNIIYNMEPVYGIVLAALVFGRAEFMSAGFYLGAGIIIAVVVTMPWIRRWVEK